MTAYRVDSGKIRPHVSACVRIGPHRAQDSNHVPPTMIHPKRGNEQMTYAPLNERQIAHRSDFRLPLNKDNGGGQ